MARLYLVSSELKPFAWRTGVSQLYGLARSFDRSGVWDQVTVIMPYYAGLAGEQPAHFAEVEGPGGVRCLFLRNAGIERHGTQVFDGQIVGGLPIECAAWEAFADDVTALVVAETDPRHGFHAMGFDWTTGPTIRRLAELESCRATVMTLDLLPAAARRVWQQGIEPATYLHVPSDYWRRHLVHREPRLRSNAQRMECVPFGLGEDALEPEQNAIYAARSDERTLANIKQRCKLTMQEELRLDEDPEAMLVFARHRLTTDDQKNHVALYFAVEHLLSQETRAQVVVSPVPEGHPDHLEAIAAAYERLADRFRGRCFFGEAYPYRLAAAADLQVYPSRFEPCGLIHLYGMTCGVLAACSRVGCVDDILFSDHATLPEASDSFLFDWHPHEPLRGIQELTSAIDLAREVFFERPEQWRAMRARAMEKAGLWTWDRMRGRYLEFFDGDADPSDAALMLDSVP